MTKREIVEAALRDLMDSNGRITPQAVVDAARSRNHPLHGCFEWDVKKAARLHWLETASSLIRMVQVRETTQDRVIVAPYFVRDPDCAPCEQGYRAIQRIRTDAEASRDVLIAEMRLVSGVLRRARSVAGALGMAGTVGEIEAQVSSFLHSIRPDDDSPTPTV